MKILAINIKLALTEDRHLDPNRIRLYIYPQDERGQYIDGSGKIIKVPLEPKVILESEYPSDALIGDLVKLTDSCYIMFRANYLSTTKGLGTHFIESTPEPDHAGIKFELHHTFKEMLNGTNEYLTKLSNL